MYREGRFITFLSIFTLAATAAFAQIDPKIELGSIAWLTYGNSEGDRSPLQQNGGDGTFLNKWTILLGAQINEKVSLYADVEVRNGVDFVIWGLSATYRVEPAGRFNIELGKFLAPVGIFLNRKWPTENPLQDWPLLYDYRTAVSASRLARSQSDILRVRGQGQNLDYVGPTSSSGVAQNKLLAQQQPATQPPGLRILSRQVYLTGAQIFGAVPKFRYHVGVTNGALSNPTDVNNSASVQLIGRLVYSPLFGLELGTSFASGAYLNRNEVGAELTAQGQSANDFRQNTIGGDLAYSVGHLVLFSEIFYNSWETPGFDENLDAVAFDVEVKYSFLPRFFAAARFSRIDFQEISDPEDVDGDGDLREPWDYDVDQLEVGVGYHFNRNGLLKIMRVMNNTHDIPGGDPSDDLVNLQFVVSF